MKTQFLKYFESEIKMFKQNKYSNSNEYIKAYKWLAKEGEFFKNIDFEKSDKLKNDCIEKACYLNTARALRALDSNHNYYFGFAIGKDGFIFQHAFIVDKNKKVIDPTLANVNLMAKAYFGIKVNRDQIYKMLKSPFDHKFILYLNTGVFT